MSISEHISRNRRRLSRGFTLVELMVAGTLSVLIGAAVVATFIFLAKGGVRLGQYSDIEGEARMAVQRFSEDARQADAITWSDANTLRLMVDGTQITYAYDAAQKRFTRTVGANPAVTLASGAADFAFRAYQATGAEAPLNASPATASAVTKMVQIELKLARSHVSTGATSGEVISARSVLRNKKIN